jgi:putative hydrolase
MSIDLHTHSIYSDGAASLEANLAAALRRGVTRLGFADHVRADTKWLPEYAEHVARLRWSAPIRVWCGVESKILDMSGRLDLPADVSGVEYLAIADHQVPGEEGPEHPSLVAAALRAGDRSAREVAERVVRATVAAASHALRHPLIVHLFSVLPKVGLDERDVPEGLLHDLARGLARAGAFVEVNEKWRCPSARVAGIMDAHGVRVVPGSDAHAARDVGRYDWVRRAHPHLLADAAGAPANV